MTTPMPRKPPSRSPPPSPNIADLPPRAPESEKDAMKRCPTGKKVLPSTFNTQSFVEHLVCAKETGSDWHHPACVYGICPRCGPDNLELSHHSNPEVKFPLYSRTPIPDTDKKRMDLVKHTSTLSKLVVAFKVAARYFIWHWFECMWQGHWFSDNKSKLSDYATHLPPPPRAISDAAAGGSNTPLHASQPVFMATFDFAQNLSIKWDLEIQSLYFANPQATLFVCVVYTLVNGVVQVTTHFVWSNDRLHDSVFVDISMRRILDYYKNQEHITFGHFIAWSDGASAHFKNRFATFMFSKLAHDYGMTIKREFFSTSHGKGVHDSEGGVLKRLVGLALLNFAKRWMKTPKDIFDDCVRNFTGTKAAEHPNEKKRNSVKVSSRVFHYIDKDECEERRLSTLDVTGVPDIRMYHELVFNGNTVGVCKCRVLSCFCDFCKVNSFDLCINKAYAGAMVDCIQEELNVAAKRVALSSQIDHKLILAGNVVAVRRQAGALGADGYPYFLMVVTLHPHKATSQIKNDAGEIVARKGSLIMAGNYFAFVDPNNPKELRKEPVLNYCHPNSVFCAKVPLVGRPSLRQNDALIRITTDTHARLMALV